MKKKRILTIIGLLLLLPLFVCIAGSVPLMIYVALKVDSIIAVFLGIFLTACCGWGILVRIDEEREFETE